MATEQVNVTCTADPCAITIQVDLWPLSMSLEEAGAISGAVMLIWAVGWAFRAFIQTIRETDGSTTPEGEKD